MKKIFPTKKEEEEEEILHKSTKEFPISQQKKTGHSNTIFFQTVHLLCFKIIKVTLITELKTIEEKLNKIRPKCKKRRKSIIKERYRERVWAVAFNEYHWYVRFDELKTNTQGGKK